MEGKEGMEGKKSWRQVGVWLVLIAGIMSLLLWSPVVDAKSKRSKSSRAARVVAKAPVCNNHAHPRILKVTPDPVTPGQKITIRGKNFGTKRCFQKVSFGRWNAKGFKYVNSTTLVASVPKLKPGLTPVNILTAGGSAEYILLVEKHRAKKFSKKVKRSKKAKRSKKRKSRKSRRSKR